MFGSLVTLFLFTYISNTSRMPFKATFFFFFFWCAHHFGYKNINKCSFMVLLLLLSSHLCKTKVIQQLASVIPVISIPFTWVLNIPISCLCISFFYCPVHTPSNCKDKGHRQPFPRRNKRPFISFSYTIKFLIFFSKEDMENRITWIPAQIHMFQIF